MRVLFASFPVRVLVLVPVGCLRIIPEVVLDLDSCVSMSIWLFSLLQTVKGILQKSLDSAQAWSQYIWLIDDPTKFHSSTFSTTKL